MSLVFSAITPHSPILIPTIGKENIRKLDATVKAMEKLSNDFAVETPDTILIISPHGQVDPNNFTLNLNNSFETNFEDFGDFSTKHSWPGNVELVYKIREQLETKIHMRLISEPNLDYGSSVPLLTLTKDIPKVKIAPLYYSGLSLKSHYELGQMLKREILISKEKIAVIASGDLSHKVTKNSPAGYSPKGAKFDKKLTELLLNKKNQDIIGLDEKLINEAEECGLRSILILLGILDNVIYEPQLLSYEAPFGIGYMVMNFKL